jgi:hypothetical protein
MVEVLQALLPHLSRWQRVAWFTTANPELDGDSPADRILSGDLALIDTARSGVELPSASCLQPTVESPGLE